ncbi:hypothetical protein TWF569_000376 [Orbilia oligospora]|uniref:Uncharacterized protein n=1 Tax=Orbilia oligospora TaxID=2813651 RepID=A0A7C8J5N7_ORBOL|nr:hypothetical protein TWF102_006797 [Orbilia oligospora]KAF3154402.1 hypothetical protein TWF569_000376 [Orbilia oligospora]
MLLELISVPSGQFLLLALYLWLSCFDFVSARRKTPTAAANQDNPPWYYPPDFYVTAQEWDDFIKPPNYTGDNTWLDFRTQYFRIIAPLTTEWYPIDSEVDGYPKDTSDYRYSTWNYGLRGSMDTSAERDGSRKGDSKLDPPEWLFQFPGQKHFPFPRDSISVRGMLKDLFNATP